MSDGRFQRGTWERARNWWWLLSVVAFVIGGLIGGIARYTAWSVDEQSRATALKALGDTSTLMLARLDGIDKSLTAQGYANQISAQVRQDYADHLHALDTRADANRQAIQDLHEQFAVAKTALDTANQRIQFLLDPKTGSRH